MLNVLEGLLLRSSRSCFCDVDSPCSFLSLNEHLPCACDPRVLVTLLLFDRSHLHPQGPGLRQVYEHLALAVITQLHR